MADVELHDQALESDIELLSVVMAAVSSKRRRLNQLEIDLALGLDRQEPVPPGGNSGSATSGSPSSPPSKAVGG